MHSSQFDKIFFHGKILCEFFYLYFKDSFRYEIIKFGQNGTNHGVPEVSNYKKGHLGNPF